MSPVGRPSDDSLWAGVEQTLRDVVLPAVADGFARISVVQIIGLAHYARTRGDDPTAERVAAVAAALDGLADRAPVTAHWPQDGPRDAAAVMGAAAGVLVSCVALPDDDHDALAVRAALRPVLVAHLDDDLAGNAVLMSAFRGRLPDA